MGPARGGTCAGPFIAALVGLRMPSLDIVSKLNFAELDNAINNAKKAVLARFDFRGSHTEIEVVKEAGKKEQTIKLVADDESKMKGLQEMFESACMKRGILPRSFDWGEVEPTIAGKMKRIAKIQNGIPQEKAKEMVKRIKETKLKVQASIQGDEIRLSGKQIDDLQSVMKLLEAEVELPLQFVNMKRD